MTTSPSPSSSASDAAARRWSRAPLLLLLAVALPGCRHAPPPPAPGPRSALLDRALDLFASEGGAVDRDTVRAQIDALARDAAARLPDDRDPTGRVAALNRFFFEERGFTADDDLRDPDNLLPDRVLRRRRGYCTGLALIYQAVAARLGMPVHGVSTPQHLFLRYDDGARRINIETQAGGRAISDDTYRTRDRIPPSAVEQGVFLANLDDDRFLSQLANNLGALHSNAGDPAAAAARFELALRLDPRNPTAHYNLATLRLSRGDLAGALDAFTAALSLHPNHVPSLVNRGACRARLGDVDGATADFLAALALDPGAAEARRNLETMTGAAPPPPR